MTSSQWLPPRRARGRWARWLAFALLVSPLGWSGDASAATSGARAPASARDATPTRADVSELYDAGTEALARGDIGPAVAFLKAALRIEPRAHDIRTNLGIARRLSASRGGVEERVRDMAAPAATLSAGEWWWLAAIALALGASAGLIGLGRRSRLWLLTIPLPLIGIGLAIAAIETSRWIEEAARPEAVVVVPILDAAPAADERPRPPYLLGAGEEVRVGRTRGDATEVWVGGNPIGWASRSGLWRVIDAPRYTRRFALSGSGGRGS